MKTHFSFWRAGARLNLVVVLGLGLAWTRLSAADAPDAAAPAPKPATPPAAGMWFVFAPPANAEEVLAAANRVKMLTVAKTFLERDLPELHTRLKAAENPFYAKQAPPPEPVVPATASTGPAQPAEPPKLGEEEKLKAVGEKLQPTGILEAGNRRLVAYSGNGGGTIDVGTSFTVSIPPDLTPVSIQLVDANDTSCALKLNNTIVTVNYVLKTSSPARQPVSPSPSQPKP